MVMFASSLPLSCVDMVFLYHFFFISLCLGRRGLHFDLLFCGSGRVRIGGVGSLIVVVGGSLVAHEFPFCVSFPFLNFP